MNGPPQSDAALGERPTSKSVLGALTKARLADVGRGVGFPIPEVNKDQQVDILVRTGRIHFRSLLTQPLNVERAAAEAGTR